MVEIKSSGSQCLGTGMTEEGTRMTEEGTGMTEEGAGMTGKALPSWMETSVSYLDASHHVIPVLGTGI
ncbi:hypothetical protein [Wolbachia endosymbiont (group A) of Anthophora plumipes]|uniref:hypothetical protein n=1 Tax=Wolbachia endosymbiont (group A) of Anthophora plumipes TaxID=3066194 RepID=UPI003340D9CD